VSSRNARVLAALSLGFGTVVFDATALSIALPAVGASVGRSLTGLQWVINSYVLAFAGFLLLTGRLADRLGARRMLMTGTVLFASLSLACAAAQNLEFLVPARFLQGVAGAAVMTSSYALLAHVFSEPHQRANAIATLNFGGTIGLSSGPVIAGILVEHLSWRWIFLPNAGVALVIVLALKGVHDPPQHRGMPIDLGGQVLSVLTLGGLATWLIEGRGLGWSHPAAVTGCAVFLVCGAAFMVVERRHPAPMLPLALFRVRSFAVSSLAVGLWRFSVYGLMFFLSLYFQEALHYSSGAAGLAFLPFTAAPFISNAASGQAVGRYGPRMVAAGGFALAAAGACLLLAVDAGTPYWLFGTGLALIGFGGGFAMPAVGVASLHEIPPALLGIAAGVYNAGGQTGMLVGVALIGSLATDGGIHGLHAGAVITATAFTAGALVTVVILRGGVGGGRRPA
jgi:DHA2 family methylenomycin A resistance protein-like MFS transporter